MKFIIGIVVGFLIAGAFCAGNVYATRNYSSGQRTVFVNLSDDSIPMFNDMMKNMWNAIDDLDRRVQLAGY